LSQSELGTEEESNLEKSSNAQKLKLKQKNRANSIPYCTSNSCKLSRMHGKQIPGSFGCAWNFFILAFCRKRKKYDKL
jgi:hypothetical protein